MAKKKNRSTDGIQDIDSKSGTQTEAPAAETEKPEKADRTEQGEKSDKAERPSKIERPESAEGQDKRSGRPAETASADKPRAHVKEERTPRASGPKPVSESAVPERRTARRKEDEQSRGMVFSSKNIKDTVINVLKILLPVAACVIVIAVLISFTGNKNSAGSEHFVQGDEGAPAAETAPSVELEPLEENSHADINALMTDFYTAQAAGDIEKIKTFRESITDKEIITYEERSKIIESYDDLNCYTKPGMAEDSYFVYVSYNVKIKDIETKAPALKPWYVYKAGDGSLKIKGVEEEENIFAAFKLVTVQNDVADLFKKIDASYKEALSSDAALSAFIEDFPSQINNSVGVALAQLETQDAQPEESQPQAEEAGGEQAEGTEAGNEGNEQPPQNQTVNQKVRATATVNVRSSDSEEADKIGKAQTGAEMTRVEERVNGWSKVIFDGKEAYIKSDYLEVVSTEAPATGPVGSVKATTNVNVRNAASQDADKLGTAQSGASYDLLEDQGEWLKISYNGQTGFVKAEFFER